MEAVVVTAAAAAADTEAVAAAVTVAVVWVAAAHSQIRNWYLNCSESSLTPSALILPFLLLRTCRFFSCVVSKS